MVSKSADAISMGRLHTIHNPYTLYYACTADFRIKTGKAKSCIVFSQSITTLCSMERVCLNTIFSKRLHDVHRCWMGSHYPRASSSRQMRSSAVRQGRSLGWRGTCSVTVMVMVMMMVMMMVMVMMMRDDEHRDGVEDFSLVTFLIR